MNNFFTNIKGVTCIIALCIYSMGVAYTQSPTPSASPSASPAISASPSPTPIEVDVSVLDEVQTQLRGKATAKGLMAKDTVEQGGFQQYYSASRATVSKETLLSHIRFEEGVMNYLDDKYDAADTKWAEADKLLRALPVDSPDAAYLRRVNTARAYLWLLQLSRQEIKSENLSRLQEFIPAINSYSLPKDDVVPTHQLEMEQCLLATNRILEGMNKINQAQDEDTRLKIVQQTLATNCDEQNLNDQLIKSENKSKASHEALVDRLVFQKNNDVIFPTLFRMAKGLIPSAPSTAQPILMGMFAGWSLDADAEGYASVAIMDYPDEKLKIPYAKSLVQVMDTLDHYPKRKHLLAYGMRSLPPDTWPDDASALKAANLFADGERIDDAKAIIAKRWPQVSSRPAEATLVAVKCAAFERNATEAEKLCESPTLLPETYYWLAVAETRSGHHKAALANFDKFLANPGTSSHISEAMFQAALACLNTGQRDQAQERFALIASNYPESTFGIRAREFLSHLQIKKTP